MCPVQRDGSVEGVNKSDDWGTWGGCASKNMGIFDIYICVQQATFVHI